MQRQFLVAYICLTLAGGHALSQTTSIDPSCANNKPCGPSGTDKCEPCAGEGANPFSANGGNVARHVTDLETWAGVGQHLLNWRRTGFSRYNPGRAWFGEGHGWRHSYQYEMVYAGTNGSGQPLVDILYPDGSIYRFTRVDSVNYIWKGVAACKDNFTQNGAHFHLQTAEGWRYHFERFTNSDGSNYYQFQDFSDAIGNSYSLGYDSSRRLAVVSEPAGRYIAIGYQQITANRADFATLKSISTIPAVGQWTELTVTNPTAYRYLRLYSANAKNLSVAEIEFYDENSQLITGTPIGTAGFSNEDFAKALDGNLTTAFRSNNKTYGFAGLDVGEGNAKRVSKVRLYPRAGSASDLTAAVFQGSNVAPALQTVISGVTTNDGRSVSYNYELFDDSVLATDYVTLTGAIYGDGTAAAYVYGQSWSGVRPVMIEANDPRGEGRADRMKYEYWTTGGVQGVIKVESNAITGAQIAKLEGIDGQSTKVTYSNGSSRRFAFPAANANQITARVDGLERRTTFSYDTGGQGFLASVTDPLNRTTSYTRSPFGNLLSKTYPDGAVETWTRDDRDLPLTYKLQGPGIQPRETIYTRDAQHRVIRIDYPDGSFEAFTHNTYGQPLTHTLRNGGVETNAYDVRGLRISATDALQNVTTYAYDACDRVASVTDARNHVTAYEYNERGRITKVINADQTTSVFTYDVYGNKISEQNELGKIWAYAYDEFSRLVSAVDPLNRVTQYSYGIGAGGCSSCHADDKVTQIILPSGKITKYNYDSEWQKTSETVAFGTAEAATTTYVYNAGGRIISITDPRGKSWSYSYDVRDRRVTQSDPLNNTTTWAYDAAGNAITITRPDNGTIAKVYDAMNRVISVTDPSNQTTTYAYGGIAHLDGSFGDNLVRIVDARGNAYNFSYNLVGGKTSMIYPASTAGGVRSHEDWTYDAVGNVVTYTTRAGQVKTCTYDARDRDVLCDWSDSTPDVSRLYDAAGRLITIDNGSSILSYTYDAANQMLAETQNIIGAPLGAKTFNYTYDADGNRATLAYPDGKEIAYHYTARNQVGSIDYDGAPPMVDYGYDLSGKRVSKTLENGASAAYTYDDAGRLQVVNHSLNINGAPSNIVYTYGLNSVGNRTDRTEAIAGYSERDHYTFTADEQIDTVRYNWNQSAGTQDRLVDYDFDATGNRVAVTDNSIVTNYASNSLNQYTAVNGLSIPAYDTNGNLVSLQQEAAELAWNYNFDAQNRLVSGTNGASSFQFSYDGRNRCVKRVIDGVSLFNLYEDWNLVAEYDGSGIERRRYIHGGNVDETLATVEAAGTVYHHHDGLGSVAALTNGNHEVIERYGYDIFGTPKISDPGGAPLSQSLVGNRFLFTGREWFSGVGMYDYRNRIFAPSIGRFLQGDPIRFNAGDINLYRYVANAPQRWIDPDGLEFVPPPPGTVLGECPCGGGSGGLTEEGKKLPKKVQDCILAHEKSHKDDACGNAFPDVTSKDQSWPAGLKNTMCRRAYSEKRAREAGKACAETSLKEPGLTEDEKKALEWYKESEENGRKKQDDILKAKCNVP